MVERYNIDKFLEACRNPEMFLNEVYRLFVSPLNKKLFEIKYGNGTNPMEKDWDNLIILDACRYDIFDRTNFLNGDLTDIVSNGSHSLESIKKNFMGGDYQDTIYVTSNPHAEEIGESTFFRIKKTYGEDSEAAISGAEPDHVTNVATEMVNKYPNKRLIVHYMQPHTPYLGPYAKELRQQLRSREGLSFDLIRRFRGKSSKLNKSDNYIETLRTAAKRGYITDKQLNNIYEENIKLVLKSVDRLISKIDGKSVVTSDHGELLGNTESLLYKLKSYDSNNLYGHPKQTYIPELRIVPWLEIKSKQRREITAEKPVGVDNVEDQAVEDHLKALGYIED